MLKHLSTGHQLHESQWRLTWVIGFWWYRFGGTGHHLRCTTRFKCQVILWMFISLPFVGVAPWSFSPCTAAVRHSQQIFLLFSTVICSWHSRDGVAFCNCNWSAFFTWYCPQVPSWCRTWLAITVLGNWRSFEKPHYHKISIHISLIQFSPRSWMEHHGPFLPERHSTQISMLSSTVILVGILETLRTFCNR